MLRWIKGGTGLFEECGFENNPENIMMLCRKANGGLRLECCSLVGSPSIGKETGRGERQDHAVHEGSLQGL